eukprot:4667107-Prorocentrum_lima.AAC.1
MSLPTKPRPSSPSSAAAPSRPGGPSLSLLPQAPCSSRPPGSHPSSTRGASLHVPWLAGHRLLGGLSSGDLASGAIGQ